MMALLLSALLGAVVFQGQEVPGIVLSGVDPLTGNPILNFRQDDMDGDGNIDLIFGDSVAFQDHGRFGPETRVALEPPADVISCDLWQGALYFRRADGLTVVRWDGAAWKNILDQSMQWPDGAREPIDDSVLLALQEEGVRFSRFLHDINGDGTPEIILPSPKGLHVYAKNKKKYAEVHVLDVFPPLVLAPGQDRDLWPPQARRVHFPNVQMSCQFAVRSQSLTVIERLPLRGNEVRYATRRYRFAADFSLEENDVAAFVTEPMPRFVEPCWLNGDDQPDFAGGRVGWRSSVALPAPMYETVVSVNGGRRFHHVRMEWGRPHCMLIDVNGDGLSDLILESTGMFRGGAREAVTRLVTQKRVDHELAVRFQSPAGTFSDRADMRLKLRIVLTKPPIRQGPFLGRYEASELVNITGDFDGDGKRDVAVQDRIDRIAIYLNEGDTFTSNPAASIAVGTLRNFGVADVDGDGRSDIIVQERQEKEEEGYSTKVFFSK